MMDSRNQTESLEFIRALVSTRGFNTDSKWLDYNALNSALKHGHKDIVEVLLNNNCRVNKPMTSHADTPLHRAVQLADLELISELLKRKATIAIPNADGDSPLHLAFLHGQEKLVDIFLDFIVQRSNFLNLKNNQGLTHLHIACTTSNAKAIEGFLNQGTSMTDVISNDSIMWAGYNAFHFAAEFKSLTAIKVLMLQNTPHSLKASLLKNSLGKTPLQLMKQQMEDLSIMTSLMIYKGFSPFHMACVGDDTQLMKSFLDNHANLNKSLYMGNFCCSYSPLHFATQSMDCKNVELLLKYGAHTHPKNEDNMTPLHLALYNKPSVNSDQIIQALYHAEKLKQWLTTDKNGLNYLHAACSMNDLTTVEHFLRCGVDINSKVTYEGQQLYHYTPLHFAIKKSHLEMAKYLIERGAEVNCGEDCVDGTPLHLACKIGHPGLIDLLIESGADVKVVQSQDKKTPLHLLIENNPDEQLTPYISKLLESGIDVNARDVDGSTILHVACEKCFRSRSSRIKLLLEHGADINIRSNWGMTPLHRQLLCSYLQSFIQPGDYTILYHHVQELKTLGLTVIPILEVCCKKLLAVQRFKWDPNSLDFKPEELERKQQQRVDEMEKLKNIKLTNEVSLYDFVRMEPQQAKEFVTHETLIEVLQKELPVYGYLLRLQHRKAVDCVAVKDEGSSKRKAEKVESGANKKASKRRRAK